jgi:hypothetical protein
MGNVSVVVNYKSNEIFTADDAPDAGYVQFTRSGNRVYLSVDGKSVGFVPVTEFDRVQKIF